jgi:hypothetical protein
VPVLGGGAAPAFADPGNGNSGDPPGSANGLAVGKPCAGCVGKADNKNPPGQFPNGSDANAGYECDRNNGIGKTNPAHTGCAESPLVPETPPVPVTPPAEVIPPVNVVTPPALVTAISPPSVSIPSVSVPARALPVTGSGVILQLLLGLAALVVGGAMTVMGRRRLTRA